MVVGLIDILTINEPPWMEFIRNQTRNHLLLTVTSSPLSAIIVLASAPTNYIKRENEPEISLNRPNKISFTPLINFYCCTWFSVSDTHKKSVWVIVGASLLFGYNDRVKTKEVKYESIRNYSKTYLSYLSFVTWLKTALMKQVKKKKKAVVQHAENWQFVG